MSTLKQIAANRRNAQESTGPRTEAGKAVSRFNALKSGIDAQFDVIPGENLASFQELIADYYERYQPATPEARFLVDTLVTNDWLLSRLRRAEAELWTHQIDDTFKHHEYPRAMALANESDSLDRLQRRMNALQRNYHRALADLRGLKLDPPQAPQPSAGEPAPGLTLVPTAASQPAPAPIGFVPPKSPLPVREARQHPQSPGQADTTRRETAL